MFNLSNEWWDISITNVKWLENFDMISQSQSQSSASNIVVVNWKTQTETKTTNDLNLTLKAKTKVEWQLHKDWCYHPRRRKKPR